jgi:hypothetical protein
VKLFSYFFRIFHIHDFFFISCVIRHVGRLLFCAISGVGFRAVKVFQKNTTRSLRRCGDFFENPQGLTFTAR